MDCTKETEKKIASGVKEHIIAGIRFCKCQLAGLVLKVAGFMKMQGNSYHNQHTYLTKLPLK